jgi:prephenate dehydratase
MVTSTARIAIQGEPGAYSESAVRAWYGDEASLVPCATFREALDAVHQGRADVAVLPIENAIVGEITESLEAIDLHSVGLHLGGTIEVPVEHCVLAMPGASLATITRVRSHPVALAQCGAWIAEHHLVADATEDTAGAARDVARAGDLSVAAIASERAGELYGLQVLARDIADHAGNWTRFVRLRRET